MAANAYVMLNVEPAKTEAVVKRLGKIQGAIVREVTGPYDVIVELTADTTIDLTSIVRSRSGAPPASPPRLPASGWKALWATTPAANSRLP